MTDADHLLRAVCEFPDEDTPRLMWADAIQDADPERAELVRVQCVTTDTSECSESTPSGIAGGVRARCRRCIALAREHELLAAHADRWRKGPVCFACKGKGAINVFDWKPSVSAYCDRCHGTGDAGGLTERFDSQDDRYMGGQANWYHPITYHRGMKRVECRAADVWEPCCGLCGGTGKLKRDDGHPGQCPRCRGSGNNGSQYEPGWRPTPWALAVCKHHPDVTEMWVTDAMIYPSGGNDTYYVGGLGLFPAEYWRELQDHRSERAARTALARAVVRWVRAALELK